MVTWQFFGLVAAILIGASCVADTDKADLAAVVGLAGIACLIAAIGSAWIW